MSAIISCVDHFGNKHEFPAEKFKFRISVRGILGEKDTILMVQEKWTKKWEFPGGGINIDESIYDGLGREFFEETGLYIEIKSFLTFEEEYFYAEDRDEAWHNIRMYFFINKRGGVLRTTGNNKDVVQAAYVKISDILAHNYLQPSLYSVLRML